MSICSTFLVIRKCKLKPREDNPFHAHHIGKPYFTFFAFSLECLSNFGHLFSLLNYIGESSTEIFIGVMDQVEEK